MSVSRALLVFAKAPKPGNVKTRLLPAVSPKEATDLHAACIVDTLRLSRGLRRVDVLWFTAGGPGHFRKLRKIQPGTTPATFSQRGGNLGARLEHAFGKGFRAGYREIVVIGTDTPWMGSARLRAAFVALRAADVVIGPAEDGGYYLLGMNKPIPEVFRDIPWSTDGVLTATLKAISRAKLRVKLLPKDFDLDRPKDLQNARRLLKTKPRLAPALAAAIRKKFPL